MYNLARMYVQQQSGQSGVLLSLLAVTNTRRVRLLQQHTRGQLPVIVAEWGNYDPVVVTRHGRGHIYHRTSRQPPTARASIA